MKVIWTYISSLVTEFQGEEQVDWKKIYLKQILRTAYNAEA